MKTKYIFFALAAIVILITFKFSKPGSISEDKTIKNNVDQWFLLSDSIEKFSILFPSKPEYQENEVKSEIGFIKSKLYALSSPAKDFNIYYAVIIGRYIGVDKYDKNELDDFFSIRGKGAAENFNGKVILEEKIKLNMHEGRKFKIQIGDNTIVTICCYLVGDKLYGINIITPQEYASNENMYKFLDSFKIN